MAARRTATGLRPELNPVEGLWANLKNLELANRPTSTLAEVADATEHRIQRVGDNNSLVVGFLATPASPLTHEPSTQPTKLNSASVCQGMGS